MILARTYACKLIRANRATVLGAVYEPNRYEGERAWVIIKRSDMNRIDHYRYSPTDRAAVDAAERHQ